MALNVIKSPFVDLRSPRSVRIFSPVSLVKQKEQMKMPKSEKWRFAEEVVDRWVSFQMALSNKRKYPVVEFNAFATSVRRYVEAIGRDPLIHREIANAINGLVDFLAISSDQ